VTVPLFDTSTQLAPLRDQLRERIEAVLDDGRYILGPDVQAFEQELADYLGVAHMVGVANGTDALTIALRAAGVGPGDEVVVPSFTFYASAEAIPPTGATPVFCDVDGDSRNVTVQSVRAVLTPRTRAIVAVDLFGNPCLAHELREELGLPVIEDAAQAAGSSVDGRRAGSLGDVATFSFFPSKNLGCFGDGGAIATDDEQIAERARMLRFHGSRDKSTFEQVGYNSRLDTIQAAVLRVLLPHLDTWTEGREAAARAYERAGLGELVGTPSIEQGVRAAWHLYVVTHPEADRLAALLREAGIEARGYYRTPIHRQPAMAPWGAGVDLPATDELARTNLALPISPVLSAEQALRVTSAIASALDSLGTSTSSPPGARISSWPSARASAAGALPTSTGNEEDRR
jgi:UDP-N-acetyl-3-dehydro-alpha-D-glucosamine 3-aminotranferase